MAQGATMTIAANADDQDGTISNVRVLCKW